MAVLSGLPPKLESLIVSLDVLGNKHKLSTLDNPKTRLLQEEQRSRCEKKFLEKLATSLPFSVMVTRQFMVLTLRPGG